jgi:hypothetical protein
VTAVINLTRAMPEAKSRKACYNDSLVAYWPLRLYLPLLTHTQEIKTCRSLENLFSITIIEKTRTEACKLYVSENSVDIDMQYNSLDFDKLQQSVYWNGTKLWGKAGEVKRGLLNE